MSQNFKQSLYRRTLHRFKNMGIDPTKPIKIKYLDRYDERRYELEVYFIEEAPETFYFTPKNMLGKGKILQAYKNDIVSFEQKEKMTNEDADVVNLDIRRKDE